MIVCNILNDILYLSPKNILSYKGMYNEPLKWMPCISIVIIKCRGWANTSYVWSHIFIHLYNTMNQQHKKLVPAKIWIARINNNLSNSLTEHKQIPLNSFSFFEKLFINHLNYACLISMYVKALNTASVGHIITKTFIRTQRHPVVQTSDTRNFMPIFSNCSYNFSWII